MFFETLGLLINKFNENVTSYLRHIVLGSVAVSAIFAGVLLRISVAIKASFLKFNMCNICQNSIA